MSGGFKWRGSLGDNPCGVVNTYGVAAGHSTRLAIGDAVVITSTAGSDGTQQVDAASASGPVTGVIIGIVPDFATESFTDVSLPASTAGQVLVQEDPRAEYEVDVANGPLAVADVGLNAPIVVTAATQSGGLTISNMEINDTGAATTATLPFRIVRLLEDDAGVLGNRAIVRVNASTNVSGAAGV